MIRKKLFLLSFLSLIFVILACTDSTNDPTDNTINLAGTIKDINSAPVTEAIINALDANNAILTSDTTNDEGQFYLANMPNDYENIKIEILHPQYQYYSSMLKQIMTEKGSYSFVNLVLMPQDSCCGWLFVELKDSTGQAISEAEVRVNKGEQVIEKLYTNSEGKVAFDNLCEGEYWVRIAREGFKVIEKSFTITDCDTVNYNLTMEAVQEDCCTAIVKIYPKDSDTEEALTGATVKMWREGELIETVTVNNDGVAIFDNVCEGKVWFDIIKDGYNAIEFYIEVECGETYEKTKMLEKDDCCKGNLKIVIKDSASSEALKAYVKVRQNGQIISKKYTNEDGLAFFEGICEGEYEIAVLSETHKSVEFSATVICDSTVEVTKYLAGEECCEGKILLLLKDETTGEKLKNATVKLWKNGQIVKSTKSNENGLAVMEGICKGGYGVSVHLEGYVAIEFEVGLECNQVVEKTKTMSANTCCTAVLKLKVLQYDTDIYLDDVKIEIYYQGDLVRSKYTDGTENWVVFEELCAPKKYVIVVTKDGYQPQEFYMYYNECKTLQEHVWMKLQ